MFLSQTVHAYLHSAQRGELRQLAELAKMPKRICVSWVRGYSRSSNLVQTERAYTTSS